MTVRTKKPPTQTEPIVWSEAKWPEWEAIKVLAVDQSLVNSGWVMLSTTSTGRAPSLTLMGTLRTEKMEDLPGKGYYDSFARTDKLYEMYRALIISVAPDVVFHEMPMITGRAMNHRLDASIMTGVALRCAAISRGVPFEMMQAQHVKKILTGNGNAQKPFVREQVKVLYPEARWNEHTSDAAALGLVAILDGTMTRVLAKGGVSDGRPEQDPSIR